MPRTAERGEQQGPTRTWERDPYVVEPALTLAEWRAGRQGPFVEVVIRHDESWQN
jgi:hypothetical protein